MVNNPEVAVEYIVVPSAEAINEACAGVSSLYYLAQNGEVDGWKTTLSENTVHFSEASRGLEKFTISLPADQSGVDITLSRWMLAAKLSERFERTYKLRPDLEPRQQPFVTHKTFEGDRILDPSTYRLTEETLQPLSQGRFEGLLEDLHKIDQIQEAAAPRSKTSGSLRKFIGKLAS